MELVFNSQRGVKSWCWSCLYMEGMLRRDSAELIELCRAKTVLQDVLDENCLFCVWKVKTSMWEIKKTKFETIFFSKNAIVPFSRCMALMFVIDLVAKRSIVAWQYPCTLCSLILMAISRQHHHDQVRIAGQFYYLFVLMCSLGLESCWATCLQVCMYTPGA